MVDGLKKFLRQESDYQWLSLFMFFLFVLGGAFAISVTGHFSGGKINTDEHSFSGMMVLDSAYTEDGDIVTFTFKPDFGYALQWEDSAGVSSFLINPNNVASGESLSMLKELNDGSVIYSYMENSYFTATEQSTVPVLLQTPDNATFTTLDAQVDDGGNMMILVSENSTRTIRGIQQGGSDTTYSLSVGSTDDWRSIEHLDQDLWVISGVHRALDVSNPVSPITYLSVGIVKWDGIASNPPELVSKSTFSKGQFHSAHKLDDGSVLIAGTAELIAVHGKDSILSYSVSSSISITDGDTVWLFNDIETSQMTIYTDGDYEHRQLSMDLPLQPRSGGIHDSVIQLHGQNALGDEIVFSIDTSHDGSLQSGRGFLNAMFIFGSCVIFGVMFWNIALVWKKY